MTLHLAGARIDVIKPTLREELLGWLVDPNIALLFLVGGALLIYLEFNTPGTIVPGALGTLMVLLAIFGLNLLPIRYTAVLLLVAAMVLLVLEAKFGGHGALAIAGIVCLTFGTLTLVAAPVPEMGISPLVAISVSAAFGAITVFLVRLAVRARQREVAHRRGRDGGHPRQRRWSRLRPRDMCWWRARSGGQWPAQPVAKGAKLRVVGHEQYAAARGAGGAGSTKRSARGQNAAWSTIPAGSERKSHVRVGDYVDSHVWLFIAIVVLYLLNSIKILREYERGVIFRLGRALPEPKGPGIILVFRPFDQMVRISLRQEVLEVPPQDVITRDNVTIKVNAVVTLYVVNPNDAAIKVANYVYQTSQFAQTTLRSVLGEVELDELLSHRDKLNLRIQTIIDQRTEPFGVKVISVEVKQVDLPEQMLRAMAKQAEAEREKRSKIIHAEGEFNAAQKLVDAAALMATQPMTLQLRYLQTLSDIGVEKNTTIVFPLPMEMMTLLNKIGASLKAADKP